MLGVLSVGLLVCQGVVAGGAGGVVRVLLLGVLSVGLLVLGCCCWGCWVLLGVAAPGGGGTGGGSAGTGPCCHRSNTGSPLSPPFPPPPPTPGRGGPRGRP